MLEVYIAGRKGHDNAENKAHKGDHKQNSEPEKSRCADSLIGFGCCRHYSVLRLRLLILRLSLLILRLCGSGCGCRCRRGCTVCKALLSIFSCLGRCGRCGSSGLAVLKRRGCAVGAAACAFLSRSRGSGCGLCRVHLCRNGFCRRLSGRGLGSGGNGCSSVVAESLNAVNLRSAFFAKSCHDQNQAFHDDSAGICPDIYTLYINYTQFARCRQGESVKMLHYPEISRRRTSATVPYLCRPAFCT